METVYSVEDMYLLLEILMVDSHNQRLMLEDRERRQQNG